MLKIEQDLFKEILLELKEIMPYDVFCGQHKYITSQSLKNYTERGMKPTQKKFDYVLDCLKQYHKLEYIEIINRIEERHRKPIEQIIKDYLKANIEAIDRNDIVFYV